MPGAPSFHKHGRRFEPGFLGKGEHAAAEQLAELSATGARARSWLRSGATNVESSTPSRPYNGIMVCAACDFRSPCACERKRLADSGVAAVPVSPRDAELDRLRKKLQAASNLIAALLLEQGHPSAVLAEEAEELLRRLREG